MDDDTQERLAALEGAVAELHQRLLTLETGGQSSAGPGADAGWAQPPWPEIIDLVRRGKKILAIRRHREYFGTGLAESKDAVDRIG